MIFKCSTGSSTLLGQPSILGKQIQELHLLLKTVANNISITFLVLAFTVYKSERGMQNNNESRDTQTCFKTHTNLF